MAIDAEDLLDDDHAALGRARRLGHVAVQRVPVLGGQRYVLAHSLGSPLVEEFSVLSADGPVCPTARFEFIANCLRR